MISFYLNFYKKHSLETVYLNSSQQGCGALQEVIQRKHLAIQSTDKVATAGIPHLCHFP